MAWNCVWRLSSSFFAAHLVYSCGACYQSRRHPAQYLTKVVQVLENPRSLPFESLSTRCHWPSTAGLVVQGLVQASLTLRRFQNAQGQGGILQCVRFCVPAGQSDDLASYAFQHTCPSEMAATKPADPVCLLLCNHCPAATPQEEEIPVALEGADGISFADAW